MNWNKDSQGDLQQNDRNAQKGAHTFFDVQSAYIDVQYI